jgi:hypothetical protein
VFRERAFRSRIVAKLVASIWFGCAGHHKKTHFNGIVAISLRFGT